MDKLAELDSLSQGHCTANTTCNDSNYIFEFRSSCSTSGCSRTTYNCFHGHCTKKVYIYSPSPSPPPPENFGGSTPYLFVKLKNNYYIENDVMSTYWNNYHEKAKKWYEEDSGSKKIYTLTDYYKMTLNPSVQNKSISLLLREIEPEESYIDQVQLKRIIFDKNAELFINNDTNQIDVVFKHKLSNLLACSFKDNDCLDNIIQNDNKNVEGVAGDLLEAVFEKPKNLDNKIYLSINSWGTNPLPPQLNAFEADSSPSLNIQVCDENKINCSQYKDIHPREIEHYSQVDITKSLQSVTSDKVVVRVTWTDKHAVDSISMQSAKSIPYKEELVKLKKAVHSKDGNVFDDLKNKDHVYTHTVRGDSVVLTFSEPLLDKNENEKENYVFVSSGFYHGLRTFMYPDIDSTDSYKQEMDAYIKELKESNTKLK